MASWAPNIVRPVAFASALFSFFYPERLRRLRKGPVLPLPGTKTGQEVGKQGPPRGTSVRATGTAARAEAPRANGKRAPQRRRYQRRVGLSSGIRWASEQARDGTGQTGALAPATQGSDQGRGGRQKGARRTTRGTGHPPSPLARRAAGTDAAFSSAEEKGYVYPRSWRIGRVRKPPLATDGRRVRFCSRRQFSLEGRNDVVSVGEFSRAPGRRRPGRARIGVPDAAFSTPSTFRFALLAATPDTREKGSAMMRYLFIAARDCSDLYDYL